MAGRGDARVVVANRAQLSWDLINPDGWLAPDHRARLVVGFVETLDLTVLYDKIEAREGTAGRPAADPAVLFALWLLATMDGVGSARELDRLTSQDLAYRWVACGVPVNYHGLAEFRAHPGGAGTRAAPDPGADRKGARQTGRDRSGESRARQAQPERGRRAKR